VHDQPERGVHAYRAGGGHGARELGVEWEWGWLGEWEWGERQQGGEARWGTGGGGRVGGGGVRGWGDGDGVDVSLWSCRWRRRWIILDSASNGLGLDIIYFIQRTET
jgi:hypothetical protein